MKPKSILLCSILLIMLIVAEAVNNQNQKPRNGQNGKQQQKKPGNKQPQRKNPNKTQKPRKSTPNRPRPVLASVTPPGQQQSDPDMEINPSEAPLEMYNEYPELSYPEPSTEIWPNLEDIPGVSGSGNRGTTKVRKGRFKNRSRHEETDSFEEEYEMEKSKYK